MKIRLKGDEKLKVVDLRKKPQSRNPEFQYGLKLSLMLEFYHDNDSAFTEAELSIYTSFQFGIDSDFNFSTDPPVLANNSTTTFVIAGNTISFELMTDTTALKTLIGDNPSADAYAEFKAYKPGEAKPAIAPVFPIKVNNAVIADGSGAPSADPQLYITFAEAYALIGTKLDKDFSGYGTKTAIVDADTLAANDSEDSGSVVVLTFTKIWTWIKSKLGLTDSQDQDVPAATATAFELGRLDAGRGFDVTAMFTDEVSGNNEGATANMQVFLSQGVALVTNKNGFSEIVNLNIISGFSTSITGVNPNEVVNLIVTTTAGNTLKMNLKSTSI